jgi:hypothetical protein
MAIRVKEKFLVSVEVDVKQPVAAGPLLQTRSKEQPTQGLH